jgi:hypothetical protein
MARLPNVMDKPKVWEMNHEIIPDIGRNNIA